MNLLNQQKQHQSEEGGHLGSCDGRGVSPELGGGSRGQWHLGSNFQGQAASLSL